jgi:WD40 repeat protein
MIEQPEHPSRKQRLEEAIAAYYQASEAGQAPVRTELLARYPDLAEDLAAFLDDKAAFERRARPQAEATGVWAPAPPTAGPTDSATPAAPVDMVPYFGDYQLLGELARGGMGVVYRARQVSLNRLVALKMILQGQLASPADVQRFQAEARAAANLDHPHIVPIYEIGEHNGQHYFSMKLIEGGSLAAGAPRGVSARVRLLAAVARAVHHAHQRGILHRDLKPGNILLDADGQPQVTDFGLARPIEADRALTQSGAIVGTPGYMAPEQARAEKQLTTAVDVFAVGAILFELLTGRPPFQGKTPLETILRVLQEEPPRPRSLAPGIDGDLETICLKCLEKEPAKRYGSAEALAQELERWLRGEPIEARPVGGPERLMRWCRRNPVIAGLTAAVVVLLLAVTGISIYSAIRLDQRATEAVNSAGQADRERRQADHERQQALKEKERARDNEFQARQNLYIAQVNQAHQAWKDGQVGRMRELLEGQRPERTGGHDFRAFEWFYLRRLAESGYVKLKGTTLPVQCVAYSPDGKYFATGSGYFFADFAAFVRSNKKPAELKLWDAATHKEIRSFSGVEGSIGTVAFSPDGRFLAAAEVRQVIGGFGLVVKVFKVDSGLPHFTKKGLSSPMDFFSTSEKIAFSPDGRWLAVIQDYTVKLYDATTGKEEPIPLPPHEVYLSSLAFSPDGRLLAAASPVALTLSSHSDLVIWEMPGGKRLHTINATPIYSLAFSPDSQYLVTSGLFRSVKVWNTRTGKEEVSPAGLRDWVRQVVRYSTDGSRLITASIDQTIRLWDARTGQELRQLKGHTASVINFAVHRDGRHLVSADFDGSVLLWDLQADPEGLTISNTFPSCLAFDPDNHHLAIGSSGKITLVNVRTGRSAGSYQDSSVPATVDTLAFDPQGRRLAGTSPLGWSLWDVSNGKQIAGGNSWLNALSAAFTKPTAVAFSPDGQRLASMAAGGTVTLRDTTSGAKVTSAGVGSLSSQQNRGIAYSPNGAYLAVVADDVKVVLLEAKTGQKILELGEHPSPILGLTFRRGGEQIVSVSECQVLIQETATGKEVLKLNPAGYKPRRITISLAPLPTPSFSQDGKRLALGALGGRVTLWDLDTGQQMLTLQAPGVYATSLAFSPDGRRLAVGCGDGLPDRVYIWDGSAQE